VEYFKGSSADANSILPKMIDLYESNLSGDSIVKPAPDSSRAFKDERKEYLSSVIIKKLQEQMDPADSSNSIQLPVTLSSNLTEVNTLLLYNIAVLSY
jgi:hypothetical protein